MPESGAKTGFGMLSGPKPQLADRKGFPMTDDHGEPEPSTHPERIRYLMDRGIQPRQVIFATTALGVFDALVAGARTGTDLAHAVGADPDSLRRVLRTLAAMELLRETGDEGFALAPAGRLLCSGESGSLRGEVLDRGRRDRIWTALVDGIRTGATPAVSVCSTGLFADISQDPELIAHGHNGMSRSWSDDSLDSIAADCPVPENGLIVDVGGGRGVLLAAILRRVPGLRGILFDVAVDEAGAAAYIAGSGVGDRCRVEAGDFFTAVPGGGDVYVLCRILHDWNDAAAGQLLDRCREAMSESTRLLAVEKLLPERATDNPSAFFLDLDMLVYLGGRQRSLAEFRDLFARHRFTLERVVDRAPLSSVLVARPVT